MAARILPYRNKALSFSCYPKILGILRHCSSNSTPPEPEPQSPKPQQTNTNEQYPKKLEVLQPLGELHIRQVKSALCDLTENPSKRSELNVEEAQGNVALKILHFDTFAPDKYKMDVYSSDTTVHLASMTLQRPNEGGKLCIQSPPGQLIRRLYTLRGISHVAILEDKNGKTMLQVLSDGQFGMDEWQSSAFITTARGDRRLGRMYKSRVDQNNSFKAVLQVDPTIEVMQKLTLIGACVYLMGRYPLSRIPLDEREGYTSY